MSVVTDLHHGADGLAVSQNLTQRLGAENVAQRRLSEQLRRPGRVLDVDDRDARVGDAVVDDRVHSHRHRVTRQNLTPSHSSMYTPEKIMSPLNYSSAAYHNARHSLLSLSLCLHSLSPLSSQPSSPFTSCPVKPAFVTQRLSALLRIEDLGARKLLNKVSTYLPFSRFPVT